MCRRWQEAERERAGGRGARRGRRTINESERERKRARGERERDRERGRERQREREREGREGGGCESPCVARAGFRQPLPWRWHPRNQRPPSAARLLHQDAAIRVKGRGAWRRIHASYTTVGETPRRLRRHPLVGAVPGTDPYTRTCKRSSSLPPTIRGPGPEGPPSGERLVYVAKAGFADAPHRELTGMYNGSGNAERAGQCAQSRSRSPGARGELARRAARKQWIRAPRQRSTLHVCSSAVRLANFKKPMAIFPRPVLVQM